MNRELRRAWDDYRSSALTLLKPRPPVPDLFSSKLIVIIKSLVAIALVFFSILLVSPNVISLFCLSLGKETLICSVPTSTPEPPVATTPSTLVIATSTSEPLVTQITTLSSSPCPLDMALIPTASSSDFCLDKLEVTYSKYKGCVNSGKCDNNDSLSNKLDSTYFNYPIVDVSQKMAEQYCKFVNKQIPSSRQRAAINAIASSIKVQAHPIGAVRQTPEDKLKDYEIYDIVGNVWEWSSKTGEVWNGVTAIEVSTTSSRNIGFRCAETEDVHFD